MPGIEKSRFKCLSKAEEEELLCGICLGIIYNPLVTPCCQQTYCGDCLTQWLSNSETCPNDRTNLLAINLLPAPRLLINLLNRLEISCDFEVNGCHEKVLIANLAKHIKTCVFNPIRVCGDCGEKYDRKSTHSCQSLESFSNDLKNGKATLNLIRNPNGEEGLNFWTVTENGGNGWIVERPPANAGSVMAGASSEWCFATSYSLCSKFQIVKFSEHNIPQIAINNIRPRIVFTEFYAHRTDCASRYMVKVSLLNHAQSVVDEFEFTHTERQWAGGVWSKVEHIFADYVEGVESVRIEHSGQDKQFWAGHYGSKIAGTSIKLDWG